MSRCQATRGYDEITRLLWPSLRRLAGDSEREMEMSYVLNFYA